VSPFLLRLACSSVMLLCTFVVILIEKCINNFSNLTESKKAEKRTKRLLIFLIIHDHPLSWLRTATTPKRSIQTLKSTLHYRQYDSDMLRPHLWPSSGRYSTNVFEPMHKCKVLSFKMYGLKYVLKCKMQLILYNQYLINNFNYQFINNLLLLLLLHTHTHTHTHTQISFISWWWHTTY
jgi:hypothetical protein